MPCGEMRERRPVAAPVSCRRLYLPLDDLHEYRIDCVAIDRRVQRKYAVEYCTERIDVGAMVYLRHPAVGLFRSHVERSAHDLPLQRHRPQACTGISGTGGVDQCQVGNGSRCGIFLILIASQHLPQPPVHDKHLAELADHDVLRLQVAVDNVLRVREGNGIAHLQEYVQQNIERIFCNGFSVSLLYVVENFVKRHAFDELHRVEDVARGIHSKFMDGNNAGVLHLPGDLRLLYETQDLILVGLFRIEQHFHCDGAADVHVLRLEDCAHASGRDDLADIVLPPGLVDEHGGCRGRGGLPRPVQRHSALDPAP